MTHAVRAVALAGAVGDDSAGGQGQRNERVLVALYGAVIAAPSLNYAEWRKRAREKLNGPTTMREKARVHAFGKTPDEAAYRPEIGCHPEKPAAARVAAAGSPSSIGVRQARAASCMAEFQRGLHDSGNYL